MRKEQPTRCILFALAVCSLAPTLSSKAQEQPVGDPENEKHVGLWLDQTVSVERTPNRSLEFEVQELFDDGASNLFEYFFQGGMAFRLRPWLTLTPAYSYIRFPGNPNISYENRPMLNLTLSTSRGPWRPLLRARIEGRFPDTRPASARLRLRPAIEYTLPLGVTRRPVLVVSNEFFLVLGTNSFFSRESYTQNRFQAGVRLPITPSFSIRPYYMLVSLSEATGWDTDQVIGISMAFRVRNKKKP